MKILFTADLHLNIPRRHPRTDRTVLEDFTDHVSRENPDAVVVAGDLGTPSMAERHIRALREAVGDRPFAVCLGNHDFWLSDQHVWFPSLDSVIETLWEGPAKDCDVVLLDRENADWGAVSVVGGYGHFDLGLAVPDLVVRGVRVTEEVYLLGGMNGLYWNDFQYIPHCADNLRKEARLQASGIASRMDHAMRAGKRVLLAAHTCPWRELNGHPLGRREQDILSAYAGNSLVGKTIEARAAAVDLVVCGHTHFPVRERKLHGITSLNIGTDYGVFRGVIYDTASHQIRWIGEPIP